MKTEPNESAFAKSAVYGEEEGRLGVCEDGSYGLSKREYLAAMAMQGMLAAGDGDFNSNHTKRIAENAVNHADALIKELNKELTITNSKESSIKSKPHRYKQ